MKSFTYSCILFSSVSFSASGYSSLNSYKVGMSSYDLKQIAMNHLNKLSTPYTNYIIKLSSFDINLEIGDTIRIIDTFKDIDDLIRISKIVYYPDQPELSYIEVGQPQILFNNIYKTFNTQYKALANNLYNQLN